MLPDQTILLDWLMIYSCTLRFFWQPNFDLRDLPAVDRDQVCNYVDGTVEDRIEHHRHRLVCASNRPKVSNFTDGSVDDRTEYRHHRVISGPPRIVFLSAESLITPRIPKFDFETADSLVLELYWLGIPMPYRSSRSLKNGQRVWCTNTYP